MTITWEDFDEEGVKAMPEPWRRLAEQRALSQAHANNTQPRADVWTVAAVTGLPTAAIKEHVNRCLRSIKGSQR